MSRWSVAGIVLGGVAYLAAIFAATYALVEYCWDRHRS